MVGLHRSTYWLVFWLPVFCWEGLHGGEKPLAVADLGHTKLNQVLVQRGKLGLTQQ